MELRILHRQVLRLMRHSSIMKKMALGLQDAGQLIDCAVNDENGLSMIWALSQCDVVHGLTSFSRKRSKLWEPVAGIPARPDVFP